jgi:hypothetical protein
MNAFITICDTPSQGCSFGNPHLFISTTYGAGMRTIVKCIGKDDAAICHQLSEVEGAIAGELRRCDVRYVRFARTIKDVLDRLGGRIGEGMMGHRFREFRIAVCDTVLRITAKDVTITVPTAAFFEGAISAMVQLAFVCYDKIDTRGGQVRDARRDFLAARDLVLGMRVCEGKSSVPCPGHADDWIAHPNGVDLYETNVLRPCPNAECNVERTRKNWDYFALELEFDQECLRKTREDLDRILHTRIPSMQDVSAVEVNAAIVGATASHEAEDRDPAAIGAAFTKTCEERK